MIIADHAAEPTARTAPGPDTARTSVPERIADILLLVRTLAAYGRHLAEAVPHRALWRGFATVAQFFGTAAVPDIAVRVQRGILRALALESVLLRRAGRGRDLVFPAPRPATATTRPGAPAPRRPAPAPKPPLTFDSLPSQAELEAWASRRPVGRTIADICLDLGIAPSLCTGPFWNRVFEAVHDYQGSLCKLLQELRKREQQFDREDWKRPDIPWPARTRDAIRQALGFFVGEPLADPFRPSPPASPAAALATRPP